VYLSLRDGLKEVGGGEVEGKRLEAGLRLITGSEETNP